MDQGSLWNVTPQGIKDNVLTKYPAAAHLHFLRLSVFDITQWYPNYFVSIIWVLDFTSKLLIVFINTRVFGYLDNVNDPCTPLSLHFNAIVRKTKQTAIKTKKGSQANSLIVAVPASWWSGVQMRVPYQVPLKLWVFLSCNENSGILVS